MKEVKYYCTETIIGLQFLWGDKDELTSPPYHASSQAMVNASCKIKEHIKKVSISWAAAPDDPDKLNLIQL